MEQLFNVAVFLLFLVLWAAFAYALVANQGGLDNVWASIRGLPLIVQAVVWLLFLPVTVGLWIWESAWPLAVRLVLVAGIAGWNLWMFFPKEAVAR
jgi:hypothetical protein